MASNIRMGWTLTQRFRLHQLAQPRVKTLSFKLQLTGWPVKPKLPKNPSFRKKSPSFRRERERIGHPVRPAPGLKIRSQILRTHILCDLRCDDAERLRLEKSVMRSEE